MPLFSASTTTEDVCRYLFYSLFVFFFFLGIFFINAIDVRQRQRRWLCRHFLFNFGWKNFQFSTAFYLLCRERILFSCRWRLSSRMRCCCFFVTSKYFQCLTRRMQSMYVVITECWSCQMASFSGWNALESSVETSQNNFNWLKNSLQQQRQNAKRCPAPKLWPSLVLFSSAFMFVSVDAASVLSMFNPCADAWPTKWAIKYIYFCGRLVTNTICYCDAIQFNCLQWKNKNNVEN